MATYNSAAVSNTAIGFQKPITLQQGRALRDNPIAISEGAAGAPRILLPALETIAPGTTIRSRVDEERSDTGASVLLQGHAFDFAQIGTVRVSFDHSASRAAGIAEVIRGRNGPLTVLATYDNTSSYVTRIVDVSVIPGDRVFVRNSGSAGGIGLELTVFLRNVRFQTSGANLWPAVSVRLENTYA